MSGLVTLIHHPPPIVMSTRKKPNPLQKAKEKKLSFKMRKERCWGFRFKVSLFFSTRKKFLRGIWRIEMDAGVEKFSHAQARAPRKCIWTLKNGPIHFPRFLNATRTSWTRVRSLHLRLPLYFRISWQFGRSEFLLRSHCEDGARSDQVFSPQCCP